MKVIVILLLISIAAAETNSSEVAKPKQKRAIDPCVPNPCSKYGRCGYKDDTFYCICQGGWTGPTCSESSGGLKQGWANIQRAQPIRQVQQAKPLLHLRQAQQMRQAGPLYNRLYNNLGNLRQDGCCTTAAACFTTACFTTACFTTACYTTQQCYTTQCYTTPAPCYTTCQTTCQTTCPNMCMMNPCMPGATCIPTGCTYYCMNPTTCTTTCQTTCPNMCMFNPCMPGATCITQGCSYYCMNPTTCAPPTTQCYTTQCYVQPTQCYTTACYVQPTQCYQPVTQCYQPQTQCPSQCNGLRNRGYLGYFGYKK